MALEQTFEHRKKEATPLGSRTRSPPCADVGGDRVVRDVVGECSPDTAPSTRAAAGEPARENRPGCRVGEARCPGWCPAHGRRTDRNDFAGAPTGRRHRGGGGPAAW